jgi:hypothetical protein
MIAAIIREPKSEETRVRVRSEVKELTARFPMYPNRYREAKSDSISAS